LQCSQKWNIRIEQKSTGAEISSRFYAGPGFKLAQAHALKFRIQNQLALEGDRTEILKVIG